MTRKLICLCLMICLAAGIISVPAHASEPVFSNLDDLLSYICYDCAYMLADDFSFGYTSALDHVFSTPDALYDILGNSGMVDWSQTRYTESRRVEIKDIEYYQGYKIAQAWEIEVIDLMLTSEEKEVLRIAESIVDEATRYSQSPLQTALNLHDELVRRVTYRRCDEEEWCRYDTAVGALKYGEAECDGYSDAYYLLCTLADIPVGFQTGEADGESHMWNLIFWDGWWYQTDVTYDDLDDSESDETCTYRYFCVGSSMMEDHQWNQEYSLYDQATYNNWDYFFYTYHPSGANGGAYYKTLQDAANYVLYMRKNYDYDCLHVMVDGSYPDGVRFNDVLEDVYYDAGIRSQWTTWSKRMGDYTCFDIRFFY